MLCNNPRPGPARGQPAAANPPAGDRRSLGAELFARRWMPNDPRCHGGDGLGPVYNATSCLDCHNQRGPGGGGPSDQDAEIAIGIGFLIPTNSPVGIGVSPLGLGRGIRIGNTTPSRTALIPIHPGFRDGRSTVLHRFGVDPEYDRWRADLRSRCVCSHGFDPEFNRWHADLRSRCVCSRPHWSAGSASSLARHGNAAQTVPGSIACARNRIGRPINPIPRGDPATAGTGPKKPEIIGLRIALASRNTPPLFGAGLIDGLAYADLYRVLMDEPREVRGRIHLLKDGRLGRFGWKAQVASLEDFILAACANELGLEVPGHHQAASPLDPDAKAPALDLTAEECAALVDYVRSLPPPVSLASTETHGPAIIEEGRKLFQSIGCASCHTPDLGTVRGIYSDLLLHDMGDEMGDPGNYYADQLDSPGAPTSSEWRTAPLWGFRDSGPYLHDGRARSLAEVVAFHGGQGRASAHRFRKLGPPQQSLVQAFLDSLVAPALAGPPEMPRAARDVRGSVSIPGA